MRKFNQQESSQRLNVQTKNYILRIIKIEFINGEHKNLVIINNKSSAT